MKLKLLGVKTELDGVRDATTRAVNSQQAAALAFDKTGTAAKASALQIQAAGTALKAQESALSGSTKATSAHTAAVATLHSAIHRTLTDAVERSHGLAAGPHVPTRVEVPLP